jgi:hypothetical protein
MAYRFPKCRIVPLANHQVAFEVDGHERLRWHYGAEYPRPFFYPLVGPSGETLMRMGHPGAANHDHHRSVWFAHAKVLGIDFWSDNTDARVRQKNWIAYADGDDEAVMATSIGWYDGHEPRALLEQELVAAVRPGPDGETFLELQSTFRPQAESLEFQKKNFGFLAVRVAKHISEHFGGGTLTDANGNKNEPNIFGKQAAWMDYSGPRGDAKPDAFEGVTYFDHPSNPGHPTHWHVREDGWMGASACMHGPIETTQAKPLVVRYLLHAHDGSIDATRAAKVAAEFAARPGFEVTKAMVKHQQSIVRRKK